MQQQQVISQNLAPPPGGNHGYLPEGVGEIRMLSTINIQTRAKTYDPLAEKSTEKEPPSSQLDILLHIEKPPHDIVIRPPKSTLKNNYSQPQC